MEKKISTELLELETGISDMGSAVAALGDVIENEDDLVKLQDKATPLTKLISSRLFELSEFAKDIQVHMP